jgi:hypothetical protein
MINYAEPYKVVFEDHQSDVSEVIGRFSCPHTAKRVASEFNVLLSQRMPVVEGKPFPFYYVSTELKSGTLPWILNLVDKVQMKLPQGMLCVHCSVNKKQSGQRGLCRPCYNIKAIRAKYFSSRGRTRVRKDFGA